MNIKALINKKNSKAFTLVELLIYMGMLSILLGVLTQIFGSMLDVQLESNSNSSVEQDSRFISSRLTYDLNRVDQEAGDSLAVPANPGDQTTTLQFTSGGQTYTYSLNGTNLELNNVTAGTSDQINSYDTQISGLTFRRLGKSGGDNSVKINFTVTSTVRQNYGPKTQAVEVTAAIR